MAAQSSTTRQMALMVNSEPDSIIVARKLSGVCVGAGEGCEVAVGTRVGKDVSVTGKLSTISGGAFNVGDGVIVAVGVIVGVFVIWVGVKEGGTAVYVRVGFGVLVIVGVLVMVGVRVFVAV